MLELLKDAHASVIELPARRTQRPDAELLAARFDLYAAADGPQARSPTHGERVTVTPCPTPRDFLVEI